MKFKHIISAAMTGVCAIGLVQAQNIDDFLRFSQGEQGASARFKALGNAQTALGGDLSSVAGNPAGLGFFGQSDIALSFDFSNTNNSASFYGITSKQNKDNLAFNQAAAVFHLPTRRASGQNLSTGWLNFNIGIGYHRINNFNSSLYYTGQNDESSYADFMVYSNDQLFRDIGESFGMIDHAANGTDFLAVTQLGNAQTVDLKDKGQQSQFNLSFGANYSNTFYVGASVNFTRINASRNRLFMEDGFIMTYDDIYTHNPNSRFVNENHEDYDIYNPLLESEYYFDDEYWTSTTGNGINAKLGIIYKPVPQVQIGLSATTPTWYRLTDDYEDYFGITNVLVDGTETPPVEDPGELTYFDYNFRSPYQLSAGLAYLFEGGLVSADVDYIDYASMSVSSSDAQGDRNQNQDIADIYSNAVNFRVGAEYMIAPQFLLRGGYGFQGNPYKEGEKYTGQTVSGGIGYRVNNVYVDLTYQNFQRNYSTFPYAVGDITPWVDVKNQRHNVLLSVGFKF